jgi:arylsulfatase A-like enzyme
MLERYKEIFVSLKFFFVVSLVAFVIWFFSCTRRNSKPNIIFIMADDLGYNDLGCYGQEKIKTPNLDEMASEGVKFTQFYSGSTVCAPSRCCLMTGLHTGHCTVRNNYHFFPEGNWPIEKHDTTVAEILKESGYKTGVVGKWGLGGPRHPWAIPNNKGFDYFFGYLCQTLAHHYYPKYLWENQKMWFNEKLEYSHDAMTRKTLDFIKQNKDKPFFMYVAYTIPHSELLVPESSLKEYKGKFPEDPYEVEGGYIYGHGPYAPERYPRASRAAMITRMDRDIGRILTLLKQLGIDSNTVIFFTSDNGPCFSNGQDPEFFNSAGVLRGIKTDLYEGGIRVPLIVRWPGKIEPGSVNDQPFALWDFMPTALELAKIEPSDNIDGISFLPTLLGEKQEIHEYLYWEYRGEGHMKGTAGKQAVRMGDWKGIRNNLRENPDAPLELYNLKEDIGEKNNVASLYPEVVKKIRRIMVEARTPSESFPLFK